MYISSFLGFWKDFFLVWVGGSGKAFEKAGRTFPGGGGSAMTNGKDTLALPVFVGGWVTKNLERERFVWSSEGIRTLFCRKIVFVLLCEHIWVARGFTRLCIIMHNVHFTFLSRKGSN